MSSETKRSFEAIRPFGPTILTGSLPENIIKLLDDKASEIFNDEKLAKEWDHSMHLAGNVKQEIRYPPDFLESDEFKETLLALKLIVDQYLRIPPASDTITPDKVQSMQITSMWAVSQWAGDFNPIHIHDGELSGVIYLRVPPGLKEERLKEDHFPSVGDILFTAGQAAKFSGYNYQATPKVGDIYLFPSWLSHTVYPFRTQNQERRSVSFNLKVIPKQDHWYFV